MDASRIARVAEALRQRGNDMLFVTPGADLLYLTGYRALPLERLTCLAVRADGQAWMIVPLLERPAAEVHELPGVTLLDWRETQDPYAVLADATGPVASPLVANLMWVEKAVHLQRAYGVTASLADRVLADIRAVKSSEEIAQLHKAGAAIDQVHRAMGQWLRPGRTEREVGADISAAITAAGHATVDFVIVASGPNGASPHHEVSDRVISAGEPVVVDIGGSLPSGYCSDSTRTYVCGDPPAEYQEHYAVLQAAQQAAVEYARPGVTCESIDAMARNIMVEHGLGEYFIHRTGHGIGLETHEDPYIVSGNTAVVQPGHAFSIEPGFYLPGRFGARIEDIVTADVSGVRSANTTTHDLICL
jgi:Xaa-Pro aminopeptidase